MSAIKRSFVAMAALMLFMGAVQAMSLGGARGTAIIGRTFDISVPVTLAQQNGVPEASCFVAEVFYGDSRVTPASVQVVVQRVTTADLTLVVRVNEVVNEPVVTVHLRAACPDAVSRRYVLLADAPAVQVPAPALGSPTVVVPVVGVVATGAAPGSVPAALVAATKKSPSTLRQQAGRKRGVGAGLSAAAPSADVPRKTDRTRTSRADSAPKVSEARGGAHSRLQVDILDLAAPAQLQLRNSNEMTAIGPADEAAKAQAAALWRAINADPSELLRDAERVEGLEAQLRKQLANSQLQVREIGALKEKLVQAENERFFNPLVYLLVGLLLLCLLAVALLWRSAGGLAAGRLPWWQRGRADHLGVAGANDPVGAFEGMVDEASNSVKIIKPEAQMVAQADEVVIPAVSSAQQTRVSPGIKLSGQAQQSVVPSSWSELMRHREVQLATTVGHHASPEFTLSNFDAGHSVKAEELLDIQQQADFFIALGQTDQAINVLCQHISSKPETSALAYIDLFDIFHNTGRRNDYDLLRVEFNRVFNAEVPDFEHYTAGSRSLMDYEEAIGHIEALWSKPQVLQVIEESLFRKPDHDHEPFDIQAYRELLMLYSLAKNVHAPHARALAKADLDIDLGTQESSDAALAAKASTQAGVLASQQGQVASNAPPAEAAKAGEDVNFDEIIIPSSPEVSVDVDLATTDQAQPPASPAIPADAQAPTRDLAPDLDIWPDKINKGNR